MGVSTIFTDPFFPMLIQGVSSACNACDYSVMLWLAEPEFERRTISKIFYNGLLDGVIVASMLTDDPIIEALGEGAALRADRPQPSREQTCYVDVDNAQSSRQAVLHLLRLDAAAWPPSRAAEHDWRY
jgi:LacI family transcriptional regulator